MQSSAPSTDSMPARWQEKMESYWNDHPGVLQFINSYPSEYVGKPALVDVLSISSNAEHRITKRCFRDVQELKEFLGTHPDEPHVRALTVHRLTRDLIRLIGARFEMDYELWMARFQPSDREYFAGPLNEKGPRQFSHFNLACVEFYRETLGRTGHSGTPEAFVRNRRISHTVRLMRLIDTNRPQSLEDTIGRRVYVIRRVSGHLRRDGSMWTFLLFCDQIPGFEESNYVSDIPGRSMLRLSDWIASSLNDQTPSSHYDRLAKDGFGLVAKVLREVKSSWKILLSDFETFLEEIGDNFNDDDFITAAGFLGRRFLLNLDYFQRQLFYHQRYIQYLTSTPANAENSIVPVKFTEDLNQEANALLVVDRRLNALRDRTTAMLNVIMSLNSIKQARLAGEMAQLQRDDAATSLRQGEFMRRLTLLNMFFLPPSLMASVYGMNTDITHNTPFWSFVLISLVTTSLTYGFIILKVEKRSRRQDIEAGKLAQCAENASFFMKIWMWLRRYKFVLSQDGEGAGSHSTISS